MSDIENVLVENVNDDSVLIYMLLMWTLCMTQEKPFVLDFKFEMPSISLFNLILNIKSKL